MGLTAPIFPITAARSSGRPFSRCRLFLTRECLVTFRTLRQQNTGRLSQGNLLIAVQDTQAHVCGDILIGYDGYCAGQFDLPTGLGGPNDQAMPAAVRYPIRYSINAASAA